MSGRSDLLEAFAWPEFMVTCAVAPDEAPALRDRLHQGLPAAEDDLPLSFPYFHIDDGELFALAKPPDSWAVREAMVALLALSRRLPNLEFRVHVMSDEPWFSVRGGAASEEISEMLSALLTLEP